MATGKQWYLKACPRCQGDIYLEREDEKDSEIVAHCLQCGFEKNVARYTAISNYVWQSAAPSAA